MSIYRLKERELNSPPNFYYMLIRQPSRIKDLSLLLPSFTLNKITCFEKNGLFTVVFRTNRNEQAYGILARQKALLLL